MDVILQSFLNPPFSLFDMNKFRIMKQLGICNQSSLWSSSYHHMDVILQSFFESTIHQSICTRNDLVNPSSGIGGIRHRGACIGSGSIWSLCHLDDTWVQFCWSFGWQRQLKILPLLTCHAFCNCKISMECFNRICRKHQTRSLILNQFVKCLVKILVASQVQNIVRLLPTNNHISRFGSLIDNSRNAFTKVSILFIPTARAFEIQCVIGFKDWNDISPLKMHSKVLKELF